MKQNTTRDEYNELSTEAKIKLKTWCVAKSPSSKTYDEHYLTIGQMIEFLDEHKVDFRIDGAWRSGYYTMYRKFEIYASEDNWHDEHTSAELVDLLWESVKEILETKT